MSEELVVFGLMACLATSAVYTGSVLSVGGSSDGNASDDEQRQEYETLTWSQAAMLPVFASCSLLVMYYFFDYVQFILLFMILASAMYSSYYLFQLFFLRCLKTYPLTEQVSQPLARLVSFLCTFVVIAEYIHSGHFACLDVLALSLAVVFIVTLRFPSLKVAVLALSLLVLYDIFWVFCSEHVFGANVMVAVATKDAANPVQGLSQLLQLPSLAYFVSPTVALPIKIVLPCAGRLSVLGLGDIALPGAFVALALRSDDYLTKLHWRTKLENNGPAFPDETRHGGEMALSILEAGHNSESSSAKITSTNGNGNSNGSGSPISPSTRLFQHSLVGYLAGLIMAFGASYVSHMPQPALIYLVPTTVGACLLRARWCNKLTVLWSTPSQV